MPQFTYPTAAELREIEQAKLPVLLQTDPIFTILPIDSVDDDLLIWEQQDNYVGLQQVRGLNGQPPRVSVVGGKRYMMRPGYYGEVIVIDEEQLTRRRRWGTWDQPVSIDDLVMQAQDQLLNRRIDRMRYVGWSLVTLGAFSVPNPLGGMPLHADEFPLQTYTASVPWATVATATPLANLRAMQLLSRGISVSFGPTAKLYINRVTANNLLSNTNQSDLAGKRTSGLAQPLSIAEINTLFTGEGLPTIEIYDEGYLNDSGTFVPFIADAAGVLVGRRTSGAAIGNYRMTRNANNPNMEPGAYTKIVDNEEEGPPRTIEVHDGHNGGVVLLHPGAVVRCTF